jgi:hypothetical protein
MSDAKTYFVVLPAWYDQHPDWDTTHAAVELGMWCKTEEEAKAELKEGDEILKFEVTKK